MSDQAVTAREDPLAHIFNGLRDTRFGLAIGLAAMALLFLPEVGAAVHTWYVSTAYNHCFLVIPIAAYLIWDRRSALVGLSAAPLPLVALSAVPLGFAWLGAERLGIMEGRQLVVITMVEVLFLAVLGWRLWWAILGPLLYLYFLVPFGEFLTPKLQDITTLFIRHGVDLLGIPAYIDGYIIEIPEGTFFVAEACAGLRFLIASIAFGVLYALMMYRSPVRRAIFIVVSIIVPIFANGIRALGIVGMGHVLGSAEAAAADHIIYGWIFFSLVILLLILLGLPFREDDHPVPAPVTPMEPDPKAARLGLFAGIAAAAAAAVGPLLVMGLDHAAAAASVSRRPLDLSPSCRSAGALSADETSMAGRAAIQRLECGGTLMDLRVEIFSPRSTAGPVNAELRRLSRHPDADDTTETVLSTRPDDPARVWRISHSNLPRFVTAVGLWIDGEPSGLGLSQRLRMARTSITGAYFAPVLVTMTPVADWTRIDPREQRELETRLAIVLRSHPEIGDRIREIARVAQ